MAKNQLNECIAKNSAVTGVNYNPTFLKKKWGKELNILTEAFKGRISADKVTGTAVLLENTERFIRNKSAMKNMFALNEATNPADVSFFKQFAFNNLLAVYPNLIATDLVSTQPIDLNVA